MARAAGGRRQVAGFHPRWDGEFPSLGYQIGPWLEHYLGIELLQEQAERLVHLYRLDLAGNRVVRRAGLRAPKGKGKSPEGGYVGFAELCGPVMFDHWEDGQPVGRPRGPQDTFTPWVQFAAVSEDQTDNVLVWLYETLHARETELEPLAIDLGRTRIYLTGRAGRIEPVTAAAGSREGQPITFTVMDQTEAWKKENGGLRLASVLRRNVGKSGGWSYELQNAPEPGDGSVADRTARAWERGQSGLHFDCVLPSKVPELADRPALLEALGEVYGEARRWVNLERIADECVDADTEPGDAYRFYLNVERPSSERAFDAERWAELMAEPTFVVPDRSLVVVGIDGARYDDALAIIATHVESGFQWTVDVIERPEDADDDYEHDPDRADGALSEVFDRFEVWRAYVDPQWIDHLMERWQGRWGEKTVLPWTTHRPRQMAFALRSYRSAMTSGTLHHDGSSVFASHIRNARREPHPGVKDDDGRPMWTIRKEFRGSPLKIDAAMAGCLSWEARGDAIAAGATAKKKYRAAGF